MDRIRASKKMVNAHCNILNLLKMGPNSASIMAISKGFIGDYPVVNDLEKLGKGFGELPVRSFTAVNE